MLRQYLEIKAQCPDAILFYRIGDFYEMFYDDAVTAAKVLDIVLTSRNKNDPNPVPLCGVPHHSMQPYLEKLVEKGYKVAVCDQVEDPKEAKGVVRREITRVLTPGFAGLLDKNEKDAGSECLVAVHGTDKSWGVCVFEIGTGRFQVTSVAGTREALQEELDLIAPREIIVAESRLPFFDSWKDRFCVTRLPDWIWDQAFAKRTLTHQYQVATLSGFGCDEIPEALIAAGAALHYAKDTQKVDRLLHLHPIRRYERVEAMRLDEEARKNLSLPELVALMDRTYTSMGRRLFREWCHAPLIDRSRIEERLDAVAELKDRPSLIEGLSEMRHIYDLERIGSRLSLNSVHARDLRALAESLQATARVKRFLTELQSPMFKQEAQNWDALEDVRDEILKTLVEEPPFGLKDGGMIRDGVSSDLDELRRLRTDAKGAIAAMEDRERQRTGIGSLKVQFNRVFGYYFEISATQLAKLTSALPPDFVRKQTLANAERFITPELKQFEDKVLGAEEKIKALEYEIFCGLRQSVIAVIERLQAQARRIAAVDALLSLSLYARENKTVRPTLTDTADRPLEIRAGRHPLVERNLPAGSFVPNDLNMDQGRFFMITGPNMAGKSTVIRQTGVIVLMAQIGSFVPADEATIGIVDRIFTRVGASDRLARGESTFMVEMCETALILNHATDRSLVLLDEIGRGTSTFDGISIAWAVAEYLHDKIRARTLFATHYHELIDLALTRPGIKNYNVGVAESGGDVVFLYRLQPGGMSHSYGIHVAKLAGLPATVVDRAKEVLKNLESNELEPGGSPRLAKKSKKENGQGSLF